MSRKYYFGYKSTDRIFRDVGGCLSFEGMCCKHSHPIYGSGSYLHNYFLFSNKKSELEHDLQLALERGKIKSIPEIREADIPEDISWTTFFKKIEIELPILKISKWTGKAL